MKVDASNGEVKQLHESLNKAIDEIKTTKYEIAVVKQQLGAFQMSCNNEFTRSNARINSIEDKIKSLEIAQRAYNIRVTGIPESRDEDDMGKFISLVKEKLGIEHIQPNDISQLRRLGSIDGPVSPRHLLVSFLRKDLRNKIFRQKSKLNGSVIFLNEDLIPEVSKIFAAARRLVQARVIYRTWPFNGRLYVKLTPDSPPTLISNMDELESLKKPTTNFVSVSSTESPNATLVRPMGAAPINGLMQSAQNNPLVSNIPTEPPVITGAGLHLSGSGPSARTVTGHQLSEIGPATLVPDNPTSVTGSSITTNEAGLRPVIASSNRTFTISGNGNSNNSNNRFNFPSVMNTNVRALMNKIDDLYCVLVTFCINIAIITETWCDSSVPNHAIHLPGYQKFRRDRVGKKGGGVLVAIRENLPCKLLDNLLVDDIESIWVLVSPPKMPREVKHILLGAIYHPPLGNHRRLSEHICYCVDAVKAKFCNVAVIVAGDLNQFNENYICRTLSMKQIVSEATRESAILDKILTSIPDWYLKPEISPQIGKSDHKCVVMMPKFSEKHRPVNRPTLTRCASYMNRLNLKL